MGSVSCFDMYKGIIIICHCTKTLRVHILTGICSVTHASRYESTQYYLSYRIVSYTGWRVEDVNREA